MSILSAGLLPLVVGSFLSAGLQDNQFGGPAVQPSSFEYLEAVVESLSRSHFALKHVNDTMKNPSAVERMSAIKNASIELGIAEQKIEPFDHAVNENLQSSAGYIRSAYATFQKSLATALAVCEKLAAVKSEDDLVGLRSQISGAKVLNQQATLLLVESVTLAFASGVVPDPRDPVRHVALSMTSNERRRLLRQMDSQFGALLKADKSDADSGPLQAARSLRVLLEKKWRFAA